MTNATAETETLRTEIKLCHLDTLVEKVAKINAKISRAQVKHGGAGGQLPHVLKVPGTERTVYRCTLCLAQFDERPWGSVECPGRAPSHLCRAVPVVTVELSLARPCLAGWELLAVVEPVTGTDESIIARVPGAGTDVDLAGYRKGALRCDHCATIRNRTETFVVRHDDGRVLVVGRNCLADFLGGQSPAAILATLELRDLMIAAGCDDERGGFGGGAWAQRTTPMEWVAQVAAIVRVGGWMSATRARAINEAGGRQVDSTADKARTALWPPNMTEWSRDHRRAMEEWLASVAVTGEDEARACAALSWAISVPATDDYLANLGSIARADLLEPGRQTSILASVLSAHARATGTAMPGVELPKIQDKAISQYVGAVGMKIRIGVVEKQIELNGNYGSSTLHLMRDAAGNRVTWNASGSALGEGWRGWLVGTVKRQEVYKDERTTSLTRCSSEDCGAPVELVDGRSWVEVTKPAKANRARRTNAEVAS